MHHRGPDQSAVQSFGRADRPRASLLFTRLSILDLDARANQPMQRHTKRLIFNGELYNYREIREELEDLGVAFHTTSDTEVVLCAIDTWGLDALDRFEGMWAFALYDGRDGTLTLSRDRFGEKPLYLLRDGEDLYFGSEVNFIRALAGREIPVNLAHVTRYLMNGYKSLYKTEETFFEGVREVSPATILRIHPDGRSECWRYWTPRFAPEDEMSYEEAVAGARARLLHAVGLRLRADVPLAFCLSGGVDSGSLVSIAKREFDYDVHAFTVVNTDARYEEMGFVEDVVSSLGIRHTQVPVTTVDFIPRLRRLVRAHDAPVVTINYYAHWLLQEAVSRFGYRVSVSGTGADEMFSGYYDHHLQYLYELRREPELLAQSREAWTTHVKPLVLNPFLREWDLFFKNPDFRDHVMVDGPRLDSLLLRPWHEAFSEYHFTDDLLRNRMLNEMFYEGVPVILHEDDLNAMFWSIENRSPFLDRELFEFCNRIPTRLLIRDAAAKAVLRDAMRGIVPESVLNNRRKIGFNAPVYSFLDVHDRHVRDWLLGDGTVYELVARDRVEQLIAKPHLDNHESKFLFYLTSAKLFLEEFSS